jgi:hypothetical protein
MPKQRRNFRPIAGFPGGQWFDQVCGYCFGRADNWWKCSGKSNHSQTVRCQLLPPIGEVVPIPFDGDFSVIESWGKSRDGHPEHCGPGPGSRFTGGPSGIARSARPSA